MLYVRPSSGANLSSFVAKVEEVIRKDNPGFPVAYKFVDDQFNVLFKSEIQTTRIAGSFASLAIIICCMGLLGLAAFTAERRNKEIGIRKVLGASVAGISLLLSKEFFRLAIISFLFAFPVAWWLMKNWLSGYQYRINLSFWIFAGTGILLLMIIMITVSYQSIKAAMTDPVKSLRTE